MRASLRACAIGVIAGLGVLAPAAAAHPGGTPQVGAPGLGDPFFPLAGNGGYDVAHYDLDLAYDPATKVLDGTAEIAATATESLSRFDLDLRGFTVAGVRVNGRPATVTRDGQELQIAPARPLGERHPFVVEVTYGGTPEVVTDPDGSIEGWVPTTDGAFVVGEPQGSPSWFPGNDNPRDKATYDVSVAVPDGITAMSNGVLVSKRSRGGTTTWSWREDSPMATYLATATLGNFELTRSRIGRIQSYVAVDPSQAAESAPVLARLPEVVRFFADLVGPYPFDAVGAIVDDAPEVGYALESQTKPNFDSAPDPTTLAHEIAHQWYGDSVTLTEWPDIWLNEGFATYSEWLWDEHDGGPTPQERFDELYATPATDELWDPAPNALPDPSVLFSAPPYDRGAMTLQALRARVGDRAFFRILRGWYAENRDGNVTTADFIALAERESKQDLEAFFTAWLTTPGKPPLDAST
jgi:aminopeptidase N